MRRSLYLYSHNTRFFYELVCILKENHLHYRAIDDPKTFVPKSWALVITTIDEAGQFNNTSISKILALNPAIPIENNLLRILAEMNDEINKRKITVSIDPGSKCNGVALILGGYTIYTTNIYEIDGIPRFIFRVVDTFPNFTIFTIKIGNGVKALLDKVLASLKPFNLHQKKIKIEIVDENSTSLFKTKEKGKKPRSFDENAAIAIGHRKGRLESLNNCEDMVSVSSEDEENNPPEGPK